MSYSQSEADLLRANAELTSSNARMRKGIYKNLQDSQCDCEPCVELCKLADETPAESLAAITAPLESKIHDLSIALYTAIDSLESLEESRAELYDLRKTLNQTPEQSLAAIQDAARAEERKACLRIANKYSSIVAVRIVEEIRNMANGGEPK